MTNRTPVVTSKPFHMLPTGPSSGHSRPAKRPRPGGVYFHPPPVVFYPPTEADLSHLPSQSSQSPSQQGAINDISIPSVSKQPSSQMLSPTIQYVDTATDILAVAMETSLTTFRLPNHIMSDNSSSSSSNSSLCPNASALAQWICPRDYQIASIALSPDAQVLAVAVRHHAATNIHSDPPALVLLQAETCSRLIRIALPHTMAFQPRPQPPFHHRSMVFISTPQRQHDELTPIISQQQEESNWNVHIRGRKRQELIELTPAPPEDALPPHLRSIFQQLRDENNHPNLYDTNDNINNPEDSHLPLPSDRVASWTLAVVPTPSASTLTLYTFHSTYRRMVLCRNLPLPSRAASLTMYPIPVFYTSKDTLTTDKPMTTIALTTPRHAQYLHSLRYLIPLPTAPDFPLLRVVAVYIPDMSSTAMTEDTIAETPGQACIAIVRRADAFISWAVSTTDSLTLTDTLVMATDVAQWAFVHTQDAVHGVALARDARVRFFGSLLIPEERHRSSSNSFTVKRGVCSWTRRDQDADTTAAITANLTDKGILVVSTGGSQAVVRFSPVGISHEEDNVVEKEQTR